MKKLEKILLDLYFYLWIFSFRITKFFWMVTFPIFYFIIIKLLNKPKKDYEEWKKNVFKANFEFPGGIIDWYAFAMIIGMFGIILFLFSIYIFWISSKIYLLIEILFGIFIWIITEKNKTWMQKKIKSYLAKKGYGQYL